MDKKTIAITGSGGLAQATAALFLQQGWEVFMLAKTDHNFFSSHEKKSAFHFLFCDLTDPAQVALAFSTLRQHSPQLHALVHAAVSPIIGKPLATMTPEEFVSEFAVDVFGGFSVFQQAATLMRQQKFGSIVGLSSIYTNEGVAHPALAGYVSAKYALRGLLRELAIELAPAGVRVNAVAPSFVRTKLTAEVPERMIEFIKEKNPMHSLTTPEDVAEVIFFLCSEKAQALTGLHIPIAYGESINL